MKHEHILRGICTQLMQIHLKSAEIIIFSNVIYMLIIISPNHFTGCVGNLILQQFPGFQIFKIHRINTPAQHICTVRHQFIVG